MATAVAGLTFTLRPSSPEEGGAAAPLPSVTSTTSPAPPLTDRSLTLGLSALPAIAIARARVPLNEGQTARAAEAWADLLNLLGLTSYTHVDLQNLIVTGVKEDGTSVTHALWSEHGSIDGDRPVAELVQTLRDIYSEACGWKAPGFDARWAASEKSFKWTPLFRNGRGEAFGKTSVGRANEYHRSLKVPAKVLHERAGALGAAKGQQLKAIAAYRHLKEAWVAVVDQEIGKNPPKEKLGRLQEIKRELEEANDFAAEMTLILPKDLAIKDRLKAIEETMNDHGIRPPAKGLFASVWKTAIEMVPFEAGKQFVRKHLAAADAKPEDWVADREYQREVALLGTTGRKAYTEARKELLTRATEDTLVAQMIHLAKAIANKEADKLEPLVTGLHRFFGYRGVQAGCLDAARRALAHEVAAPPYQGEGVEALEDWFRSDPFKAPRTGVVGTLEVNT